MPALIVLSTGREPGVYKRIKPRRFLHAHSVRDVFPAGFPFCILLDTLGAEVESIDVRRGGAVNSTLHA